MGRVRTDGKTCCGLSRIPEAKRISMGPMEAENRLRKWREEHAGSLPLFIGLVGKRHNRKIKSLPFPLDIVFFFSYLNQFICSSTTRIEDYAKPQDKVVSGT